MTTKLLPFAPRRAPSRERTKLVWTGIAVVVGIIGGVLAARSSTVYLRHRLARELSNVTGMEAQVGELSLSPDGSVIRDIRLTGNGTSIHVSVVELDTDVEALLVGRTACIEVAGIERVDVVLGRGSPSREVTASPAERVSSGKPAAAIGSLSPRVAAGLRRLLTPGGRVALDMVRVFVPSGAEAAPSIPVLQSTGASLERRGESFAARADITLAARGDGNESPGVVRATLSVGATVSEGHLEMGDVRLSDVTPFLPDLPWYRPERARIDGTLELEIRENDPSHLRVFGNVAIRDAALQAAYVAKRPVELDVSISAAGSWNGEALTLDSSEIRVGRGRLDLTGAFSWGDALRLDVMARMPRQACNDAMSVVPTAVLGESSGFDWSGTFGGTVRLRVDSSRPGATLTEFRLEDDCRFERVPEIADPSRFDGVFIHEVIDDSGIRHRFETGPGSPQWVALSEVSPFLVHAVLAHEDATFFEHAGFAPFAIEDALRKNLERGRMAFGASTLSMQLAKNLFLTRDKTLARKVDEVFLTWWLESSFSKTRILELYLNVIEYGPGIYGLRRASRVYFGDEPAELTPGESVFLASLLPTPADYFRQFRRKKLTPSSKRQMASLLHHMRRRERIDDQALRYGLSEVELIDHGKRFGTSPSFWDDVGSAAVLPVPVPVRGESRGSRGFAPGVSEARVRMPVESPRPAPSSSSGCGPRCEAREPGCAAHRVCDPRATGWGSPCRTFARFSSSRPAAGSC